MAAKPPDPEPPNSPVRIRVYGLITLSRRGYLLMVGIELMLLAVLFFLLPVWLHTPERAAQQSSAGRDTLQNFAHLWRTLLPWVLGVAAVLAALEAFVILRRFARAEAAQRSQVSLPPPHQPEKP